MQFLSHFGGCLNDSKLIFFSRLVTTTHLQSVITRAWHAACVRALLRRVCVAAARYFLATRPSLQITSSVARRWYLHLGMPILFKSDDSDAVINEGDLAVVVLSHRSLSTITVTKDDVLRNKNGFFPHNSFIGKPWGLKVYSEGSDGFVRILRPTAELWTLTLPHRTQVIYQPDISLAILLLELCPGKTVAGCFPTRRRRSLSFIVRHASRPQSQALAVAA
jgi:hypothetical protein